jgi:hypothetical protein
MIMLTRSSTSLASNADRVSPSENEALISSSPPRESSLDEYSPECPSIPISVTTQFTSPSNRSNTTGSLPANIRTEIHALYTEIYGEGSQRCLVTQLRRSFIVAHVVQRVSRHDQVIYHLSVMCSQLICLQLNVYEYCLGLEFFTFHVDSRKNLLYRA